METNVDITELSQLHQTSQVKVEKMDDNATLESIESLMHPYKKEDKTYDYAKISSEDLKKLVASYSLLHWLDQIKVKLMHQELKVFLYPHIKDGSGYKFTKKNHQIAKGKVVVYYYCEAYKDCPVGIKLTFTEDCKTFKTVLFSYND